MKKNTKFIIFMLLCSTLNYVSGQEALHNNWSVSLSYGYVNMLHGKIQTSKQWSVFSWGHAPTYEPSFNGTFHNKYSYESSVMIFKHFGNKFKLGLGIGETVNKGAFEGDYIMYKNTEPVNGKNDNVRYQLRYIDIPLTFGYYSDINPLLGWGVSASLLAKVKRDYCVSFVAFASSDYVFKRKADYNDFDNKLDLFSDISADVIVKITKDLRVTISPYFGFVLYDGSLECSGIKETIREIHDYGNATSLFFNEFNQKNFPNRTYCGIRLSLEYMF